MSDLAVCAEQLVTASLPPGAPFPSPQNEGKDYPEMSSNWPPMLVVAMSAALAWRRCRPSAARAARCVATALLSWWVTTLQTRAAARLLRELSNAGTAMVRAVDVQCGTSGIALAVVLGPPRVQGAE
jgi:hypothetical protein